jgi:hypothetical protein
MARQPLKNRKMNKRLTHKSKSKKYHSIESKLKILDYASSNGKHSASKKYNVDRNQIRQWDKKKSCWIKLPLDEKQSLKFCQPKKGKHEALFNELSDYVNDSLTENVPLNTFSLIEKITELDPSTTSKSYKNLQSMVYDFMEKSNLTFKTCQTTLFEDKDLKDVIGNFMTKFNETVSKFNYENSEIYNLDETGLPFEIAPQKIITIKGAKKAIIKSKGQTKQKVTGLFLIRADGVKCKPLIVFKGSSKGRIAKEVKGFNNEHITCCAQSNAWCDLQVLEIWIQEVLKKSFPNQRKLIIMDNFAVHTENVNLIEYDKDLIKVLFLPPNTTRLLQPLDISVNNLVKKNLRQLWVKNFSKERSLISRQEMARRVGETWTGLSKTQVDSGFRKTGLLAQREESMEIEWEQIQD